MRKIHFFAIFVCSVLLLLCHVDLALLDVFHYVRASLLLIQTLHFSRVLATRPLSFSHMILIRTLCFFLDVVLFFDSLYYF